MGNYAGVTFFLGNSLQNIEILNSTRSTTQNYPKLVRQALQQTCVARTISQRPNILKEWEYIIAYVLSAWVHSLASFSGFTPGHPKGCLLIAPKRGDSGCPCLPPNSSGILAWIPPLTQFGNIKHHLISKTRILETPKQPRPRTDVLPQWQRCTPLLSPLRCIWCLLACFLLGCLFAFFVCLLFLFVCSVNFHSKLYVCLFSCCTYNSLISRIIVHRLAVGARNFWHMENHREVTSRSPKKSSIQVMN